MKSLFEGIKKLSPIPTNVSPKLGKLSGIKCVLFDVYGTLLISASGDIGARELKGHTAIKALNQCGITLRKGMTKTEAGKLIVAEYEEGILQTHDIKKFEGVVFPEVDIVNIWKEVIYDLRIQEVIDTPANLDYKHLAITFEFLNNQVYPMPGMSKTLQTLNKDDILLGIVSNAQFFTPMLLNYFLGNKNYLKARSVPLFQRDLLIYSFSHGHAKPGPHLYELTTQRLAKRGFQPSECLYIGNDMLNDIYPASRVGLRTALFAGDTRSLRQRQSLKYLKKLSPDRIITNIDQILDII